jgi:hypothetical protein
VPDAQTIKGEVAQWEVRPRGGQPATKQPRLAKDMRAWHWRCFVGKGADRGEQFGGEEPRVARDPSRKSMVWPGLLCFLMWASST